jgi:SPP1 family predicted phage head-tail adaptor
MIAGRMDRRAALQQPGVTRSASGDAPVAYTTVATVWAEKRDVRGREVLAGGATLAEMETTILIRWRGDIRPSWRVVLEGRNYDIMGMAELGRRDGLELRCVVVAD